MKTILLSVITLFSTQIFANGTLLEDDIIMRESLQRQGYPPSANPLNEIQEQVETSEQTNKELLNKINILEAKVQKMEKELTTVQRQEEKIKKDIKKEKKLKLPRVTKVIIDENLKGAKVAGEIGKYSILSGKANALVFKDNQETPTSREVPALKLCATMADANRLSPSDLEHLGFDKQSADKILKERLLTGEFTSSKEIKEVLGIDQQAYEVLQDSIIAIPENSLSE